MCIRDRGKYMEPSTKRKKMEITMPKKGKYRMQAHINPLNKVTYPFPRSPDHVDWSLHYPMFFKGTTEKKFGNVQQYSQAFYYLLRGTRPVQWKNRKARGSA
eukprot:TRINITY_DN17969_c0_g1_i2.p3 TRINITY_DN17969_c0_g1~~TRINITY_DN17969_c0_g1_i2.p3  ORF type:complete len:102 (+),score=5.77 TRINITY_DN17969_c0_g1_i2:148-453(+)